MSERPRQAANPNDGHQLLSELRRAAQLHVLGDTRAFDRCVRRLRSRKPDLRAQWDAVTRRAAAAKRGDVVFVMASIVSRRDAAAIADLWRETPRRHLPYLVSVSSPSIGIARTAQRFLREVAGGAAPACESWGVASTIASHRKPQRWKDGFVAAFLDVAVQQRRVGESLAVTRYMSVQALRRWLEANLDGVVASLRPIRPGSRAWRQSCADVASVLLAVGYPKGAVCVWQRDGDAVKREIARYALCGHEGRSSGHWRVAMQRRHVGLGEGPEARPEPTVPRPPNAPGDSLRRRRKNRPKSSGKPRFFTR